MTFSFEQLNMAHEQMRTCEDAIFHHTGMKVRVQMISAISLDGKDPKDLLPVIAKALGRIPADYVTISRKRAIVEMRFITTLFLKQYWPELPLTHIGSFYGQDHSTILNGFSKAQSLLENQEATFTSKYYIVKKAIEGWLKEPKSNEINQN